MQKYSFFNSINGDRTYKAEDIANYFGSLLTNGVFPNPSDNLKVIADSGMTVILKAGKAYINGYMYENTTDLKIKLNDADNDLGRIDRIVFRRDLVNREIKAIVKQGDNLYSPVAKDIERDLDIYEIATCDIFVDKRVTKIIQANITDLRMNNNLCGFVTNSVNTVDTTDLFNQYDTFQKAKIAEWNSYLTEAFKEVMWIKLNDEGEVVYKKGEEWVSLAAPIPPMGVKSVQRGISAVAGNVTISAVDLSKSYVICYSKGSTGTVAATGTLSSSSINGTLAAGTGSISRANMANTGISNYDGSIPMTFNSRTINLSDSTRTLSGGTTNLTTRQYSARLLNETTIYCDGAVEWQVIESY